MVLIDTNIFLGACVGTGASSGVVGACLTRHIQPLMGAALLAEYEDVLGRSTLFAKSRLNAAGRSELLDIRGGAGILNSGISGSSAETTRA